jgi:predicted DNA binding CopG/RHH family protein
MTQITQVLPEKQRRGRKPFADRTRQITLRIPQSILARIRADVGDVEGSVQQFIRSTIDEKFGIVSQAE